MSIGFQTALLAADQMQQRVLKQQEKYDNAFAEDNMNRLVRMYTQAINGATTSQEAQGHAAALESLLQTNGKALNDVQGINNPLLNNPATAGKAAGGHHQKGTEQDKKIIADLSAEFGIDVKKSGTTKDWLEKAKTDQNVKILDKNGQDITDKSEGRIKSGDILEVNSKQHGVVRIQVGGDGEINGGDDKVISMGGQAAANGLFAGMAQINNPVGQQQQQQQAGIFGNAMQPNGLLNQNALGIDPYGQKQLFNEDEIKNLVAALLYNAIGNGAEGA